MIRPFAHLYLDEQNSPMSQYQYDSVHNVFMISSFISESCRFLSDLQNLNFSARCNIIIHVGLYIISNLETDSRTNAKYLNLLDLDDEYETYVFIVAPDYADGHLELLKKYYGTDNIKMYKTPFPTVFQRKINGASEITSAKYNSYIFSEEAKGLPCFSKLNGQLHSVKPSSADMEFTSLVKEEMIRLALDSSHNVIFINDAVISVHKSRDLNFFSVLCDFFDSIKALDYPKTTLLEQNIYNMKTYLSSVYWCNVSKRPLFYCSPRPIYNMGRPVPTDVLFEF